MTVKKRNNYVCSKEEFQNMMNQSPYSEHDIEYVSCQDDLIEQTVHEMKEKKLFQRETVVGKQYNRKVKERYQKSEKVIAVELFDSIDDAVIVWLEERKNESPIFFIVRDDKMESIAKNAAFASRTVPIHSIKEK